MFNTDFNIWLNKRGSAIVNTLLSIVDIVANETDELLHTTDVLVNNISKPKQL